jgi:aminocarboxymuconate-semialdehyde decarboxylase
MLTDTAMAAAALVFGGVLDDVPSLRVGLAHGCGAFPWTYPRLARGATMVPGAAPLDFGRTDALVRRLWVDSLVFDPRHVPLLIERFGADHVMLGSDFPFYPAAWGGACDVLDEAVAAGLCTPNEMAAMTSANALRFLGLADDHLKAR